MMVLYAMVYDSCPKWMGCGLMGQVGGFNQDSEIKQQNLYSSLIKASDSLSLEHLDLEL